LKALDEETVRWRQDGGRGGKTADGGERSDGALAKSFCRVAQSASQRSREEERRAKLRRIWLCLRIIERRGMTPDEARIAAKVPTAA